MQVLDTAIVPASLPMPYVYKGLSVQGVSAARLTPYPNPNITVPPEVARAVALRNLARRITGSEIAIARVGLGLRPAGRTVAAHVQAAIFFAGLAHKVVNSTSPESTPTAAHHSDEGEEVWLGGDNYANTNDLEVEL